jgi:rfaE bifunctional protein kinase chain/domain
MSEDRAVDRAMAALRGRRAVIVGDLILDSYLYGETVRVSREAPVLVVRKERVEHRLGGAANTAANLAALGLETTVLGAISWDGNGEQVRRMLRAAGASAEHLRSGNHTMPVKTRVLAGAFGTSRQQVLRLDEEPRGAMPPELMDAIAQDLLSLGATADVVVVSDYGYGIGGAALAQAARELARRGVPVCVDSRHQLRAFAGVTAATPNVPEAEGLVDHPITGQESVERAGKRIVEELKLGACLLTQGRAGMTLFRPGQASTHVDIVGEEEVTDVTGAGDTVIAAFAASLAARLGMENAMRLANVAAGVVVTKLGAAAASPTEIATAAARHDVVLEPWAG